MKRTEVDAAVKVAQGEHGKFVRSLGQLTLAWSDAESALYATLNHYAKVSDAVARSIFSGARARVMMDYIEAIAANTKMPAARRDDLKEVFAQTRTINTMRDMLAHHVDGSEQAFDPKDPTTRFLTNKRRISRFEQIKEVLVGAKLIDQMCHDLNECCWRLIAHSDSPFVQTGQQESFVRKLECQT